MVGLPQTRITLEAYFECENAQVFVHWPAQMVQGQSVARQQRYKEDTSCRTTSYDTRARDQGLVGCMGARAAHHRRGAARLDLPLLERAPRPRAADYCRLNTPSVSALGGRQWA